MISDTPVTTIHAIYNIVEVLRKNRATYWFVLFVGCILAYYLPKKRIHTIMTSSEPSQSSVPLSVNSTELNSLPPEQPPKGVETGQPENTILRSFVEMLESDSSICLECCQGTIDTMASMISVSTEGDDCHTSQIALSDSKAILTVKLDQVAKFKVAKRLRRMGLDIMIEECSHPIVDQSSTRDLYVPSTPFRFPFAYVSQKWLKWQPKEI